MTMASTNPKKIAYDDAISRVLKTTNPEDTTTLHTVCRDINKDDPADLALMERVISDLRMTAKDLNYKKNGCLGLAANQLGYDVRIFVIRTKAGKYRPYVNPVILNGTKLESGIEGCLSVQGQYSKKRNKEISVKSVNTNQALLRGDESKAFQHELDHLNGKVISDV